MSLKSIQLSPVISRSAGKLLVKLAATMYLRPNTYAGILILRGMEADVERLKRETGQQIPDCVRKELSSEQKSGT